MYESINLKLHNESHLRERMVYMDQVCDLSDLNLLQFSPTFVSQVLKPWLSLTQSNYPETANRIYLLNPPRILSLVWGLVAPLSSPGTVAKVQLRKGYDGSAYDFVEEHAL
jgi:hypothetical protein